MQLARSTPATALAMTLALVHGCSDGGSNASGEADESGESGIPQPTTTAPATTAGTSGNSQGETAEVTTASIDTSSDDGAEGIIFDVGTAADVGEPTCGGKGKGGGAPEFSYIWVCNSGEGTISKINTESMVEEGRYQTRPDTLGSPSRTSVNLSGDVAVANRVGGITKLYARPEDCAESNGTAGIQTSTGKTDVLPWGEEECVAWHTPFDYSTQRPVAWAPGTFNPATCSYVDEMLWTAGGQNNVVDSLEVVRINGNDGSVDAVIPMPDVPIGFFGAYGGAVNQQGDFWFVVYDTEVSETDLVRVDAVTLDYDRIPVPAEICPYGFTVDSKGRPWIGSFCSQSARYTPGSDTWDLVPALGYGIQEDAEGRMWMADFQLPGVREIDSDSLTLGASIMLPGASSPKGISIDFAGHVWVVDMGSSAFRVDPDTQLFEVYNQLNGPYTYSDMTGWGLSNVTFPPG
ncbi:MAG: hypothetical protein IAG13_39175 [Deltaproteobacteria bacterium]|nr:hypothetical protein [Nannocystaceae bacterium]